MLANMYLPVSSVFFFEKCILVAVYVFLIFRCAATDSHCAATIFVYAECFAATIVLLFL